MVGMVGSSGSGLFTAAISQSSIADWLYYDRMECVCVCVCACVHVCVLCVCVSPCVYSHSKL